MVNGSLAGAGLAGIGALGVGGLAIVALRVDLGLLMFTESLIMAGLEGQQITAASVAHMFIVNMVVISFAGLPAGGFGEQLPRTFTDWTFWVGVGDAACSQAHAPAGPWENGGDD